MRETIRPAVAFRDKNSYHGLILVNDPDSGLVVLKYKKYQREEYDSVLNGDSGIETIVGGHWLEHPIERRDFNAVCKAFVNGYELGLRKRTTE